MKKIYLLTLIMLAMMQQTVSAQVSLQQAEKLDTLISKLIDQDRYADAIDIQKQRLDILKQIFGETDSTYISEMAFLGKYYARNKQLDEAIKTIRKATELCEEYFGPSNLDLACYLDNLAFYLAASNQDEEAELIGKRALDIYEKTGKPDDHLAAILMHLAESCHENKHFQEAIQYELRSLNIIRKLYGEHSEEYLGELPYMMKYYESAGEKDRVEKLKERIEKLKEERKQGFEDLPQFVEFKTPEICHQHNDDALRCCAYYLTHRLNAPNMDEAAQYILNWSISSGDVNIHIGETITHVIAKQENYAYMIAYIAASAYYCLTGNIKQLDEDRYLKTMNALLDFYDGNKDISGEIDFFEKYLKLRNKEKLDDQLRKDFKKMEETLPE